jgi:hypothetical protein
MNKQEVIKIIEEKNNRVWNIFFKIFMYIVTIAACWTSIVFGVYLLPLIPLEHEWTRDGLALGLAGILVFIAIVGVEFVESIGGKK